MDIEVDMLGQFEESDVIGGAFRVLILFMKKSFDNFYIFPEMYKNTFIVHSLATYLLVLLTFHKHAWPDLPYT